jgi:TetR/AcrR family transcriptional regulator, cholesterol catabolism regulator
VTVKEKIVEGAGELIMQFGIRTVTMDDIAKHLSMSKKTIYQYFKDKGELVNAITQIHLDVEGVRFNSVTAQSENSVHELILVSSCLRESMQEMKMNIMHELQKFYPSAWKLYVDFKQDVMLKSIQGVIERGKSEGYFRNEIDSELIALMRVEQVQTFFMKNIYSREKYSLAELQLQLFDHFIHGLFTIEGHKLFNQYITTNTQKNGTQN